MFSQTEQDFHIYAADDCSTDNTVDILNEYKDKFPGKISVTVNEKPTTNAKYNFFNLLSHSKSEYTMFCDQDDFWEADKIKLSLSAIKNAEADGSAVLLHTDLSVVNDTLRPIHDSFFVLQNLNSDNKTLSGLIAQNNITGCTVMINKNLREQVRYSDNMLMHDWWIGLIASAFGKIVYLPKTTVKYRQHGENSVGAKDVRSVSYIKSKISDKKDIRTSLKNTYMQAQGFMQTYEDIISPQQKELLQAYSTLNERNMFKRMCLLKKYRCFKTGFIRKIGQIIYG